LKIKKKPSVPTGGFFCFMEDLVCIIDLGIQRIFPHRPLPDFIPNSRDEICPFPKEGQGPNYCYNI